MVEEGEEVEKMAALKRAYADVILNTAKEAATRILATERRVQGFQRELSEAKEEALNTLLRVKSIMDSKIAEAERISHDQKQKIQELEAQLNEAEETVVDLRMELKRVQDELEKMKNNHMKPIEEQILKGSRAHVDAHGERLYSTSDIAYPLVSGPEYFMPSFAMSAQLSQRSGTDHRCFIYENAIAPVELPNGLPSRNFNGGKADLPSIIMRSKESELYRNGCTQRIRAFEQNWLKGNLHSHGPNGDEYSHAKNDMVGDEDKIEEPCNMTSPEAENIPVSKEMIQQNNNIEKGGIVRFFRRSLRKQRSKFNNLEAVTCGTTLDKLTRTQVPPNTSSDEVSVCSQSNMTESVENLSKTIGEEGQKDSNSHSTQVYTKCSETVEERKHHLDVLSENKDFNNHLPRGDVEMDPNNSKVVIEESISTNEQQNLNTSDIPVCKTNLETRDVPLVTSDIKDETPCGTVETPSRPGNDKILKYTFRRKRKRVPLSNHNDDNCSIEKKSCLKRNPADKQGPLPEPPKPMLVTESSRDSRRLVQVARQLISLSGKRWL